MPCRSGRILGRAEPMTYEMGVRAGSSPRWRSRRTAHSQLGVVGRTRPAAQALDPRRRRRSRQGPPVGPASGTSQGPPRPSPRSGLKRMFDGPPQGNCSWRLPPDACFSTLEPVPWKPEPGAGASSSRGRGPRRCRRRFGLPTHRCRTPGTAASALWTGHPSCFRSSCTCKRAPAGQGGWHREGRASDAPRTLSARPVGLLPWAPQPMGGKDGRADVHESPRHEGPGRRGAAAADFDSSCASWRCDAHDHRAGRRSGQAPSTERRCAATGRRP